MTTTEIARSVDMHVEYLRKRLEAIAALNPKPEELRLLAKGERAVARHLEKYRHDLSVAMSQT